MCREVHVCCHSLLKYLKIKGGNAKSKNNHTILYINDILKNLCQILYSSFYMHTSEATRFKYNKSSERVIILKG